MYPDFIGMWHDLQQYLPSAVAWAVFALVLLATTSLLLVPSAVLLCSQVSEIRRWYKQGREGLRGHAASGASPGARALRHARLYLGLINRSTGRAIAMLALPMVLLQFVVVVLRYVFAFGSIQMQESIWYLHAVLFMLGAGYTWAVDAHVRVDIIYARASRRYRHWTDLLGSVLFVVPLCTVIVWLSWDYVGNAWSVREGSTEVSGLPYLYILKSLIPAFALLITLEAIATLIASGLALRGAEPGAESRSSTVP
jgi:TRAP-type mannitol/chloroaromatic compound transport system permease small subunit